MADGAARWQRLQDIVQAALGRPAEARDAYLAEACGSDDELRREAASLLDQDDRASDFLATPIGELAANAVTYSPGTGPEVSESRNLVGSRIGAYEIRSRIGAGGMGEVYRAHDHSLHRDVAIKVLPSAFLNDHERLARFEREARLLASLNHPHIGAIYGLEGSGSLRGIVLELIDGETLETRLERGAIPVAQTLTLAVQIASALDHAHQHSVMHRDLKPANIMLTKGGAKLLDFGLAKWGPARRGYVSTSGSSAARPEGVESVTSEGTILGTLHYMAPEQLEGKKVDARADVFAFGAVLYEMLIGQRAFDGGSTAAVMAAVLNTQPTGLDSVQRLASPGLERIVRKCLAKDPDDRWQTTRDLADEIKWIADEAERPAPSVLRGHGGRSGLNRWAAIGAAVLALALTGWAGWRMARIDTSPPPLRAVVRFPVLPSTGARVFSFDISADGTRLAYDGGGSLYLRQLDQLKDAPIPGTDDAASPVFSPDGQSIAFFHQRRLMKVNIQTASTPVLLWQNVGRWADGNTQWLEDGTIIVGRPEQGVVRVSAEGGEPHSLTSLTAPEFDHHTPSPLPGGEALLFTVHEPSGFKIVAEVLATRERKILIESAFDARYVSTGHLVFARERTILAAPFDVRRLEVTGPPVTLVENVGGDAINGYGGYRLSKSGTLVFQPAPSTVGRTLVLVDRQGNETPVPIPAGSITGPSVSPDGRRLAIAISDGRRRDIWTYEFATEKVARITRDGDNWAPLWTRDGQRLVFASKRGALPALFWQDADDGGKPEQIVAGDVDLHPGGWSAEGSLVYADGGTGPAGTGMYSVSVEGNRQPIPRLHGLGDQRAPRVSPDGRWVAYSSSEMGRAEVFVSDLPNFSTRHQVTTEGGHSAQWSRNGQELTYRFNARMFSIPITATPRFTSGKPRELFAKRYVLDWQYSYDAMPDGRWVMIKPDPEETSSMGLQVVLNWADELARRVPTGQ